MGQHRPGWGVAGGSPCSGRGWWGLGRGPQVHSPTPTPTPTLLFLEESKKGFYLLSPSKTPTLVPGLSRHPHPDSPTFPTDPGAWPQAGWPRTPRTPLLLLQGRPDVVLQAVGLLWNRPHSVVSGTPGGPPLAGLGQGWDSEKSQDTGPGLKRGWCQGIRLF